MVPWMNALIERNGQEFPEDWWPYGISANRAALDAYPRYHHEHCPCPLRGLGTGTGYRSVRTSAVMQSRCGYPAGSPPAKMKRNAHRPSGTPGASK
jgi:hypothetical protein